MSKWDFTRSKTREGKTINKKQVFECECGKNYWNYPALYLHFKRVHKMKISTRFAEQPCHITEGDKVKTYTYFFSDQSCRNQTDAQENSQENYDIENVLQSYFKQNAQLWGKERIYLWTLGELRKYLFVEKTFTVFPMDDKNFFSTDPYLLKNLPLHFNNFVLSRNSELRNAQFYADVCEVLFKFNQWLNYHHYSDYILVLNDHKND